MVVSFVHSSGGFARTAELRDAGFSAHTITKAVRSGALIRPRKGWVGLPRGDPLLLRAASNGLLVSCVTQAKRLGLWDPGGPRASREHFAVRQAGAERRPAQVVLHWGRPLVPRARGALEDAPENVLHFVSQCVPYVDALAVWESAFRRRVVDRAVMARLPVSGNARRLLAEATPFADSGLETIVRARLRWLRIPMTAQAWVHGRRVDLLIGAHLVVQIDGATHTGAQHSTDIAHDAQLRLRGYTVVRVGYQQVMYEWHTVQGLIMRAIAQGLHRAAPRP
ncbi:type IV toxin-antitoxin system AbiEi family antitoxin domain-containing protein [Leucobacter chromiireducens]|uniref:type IV toxin-antitoxin system AbiEi family antitoxin domain-containing protein n=1 Tax=Leucobacter chromiireducens TaxID=283877 RepID=UPI000F6343A2|nr:type IV toxin-antitoxin system AbiEi family antitoxin domain-containing protein [Leucobacter chromiireducens]